MSKGGGDEGFTLLEVLVAFVILAGAVILGFRIFSDGLRGLQTARERSELTAVARRELARLELSSALRAGSFTGVDAEGFTWSAEVRPAISSEPGATDAVVPFRVRMTVTGATASRRSVAFETILIAIPQQ